MKHAFHLHVSLALALAGCAGAPVAAPAAPSPAAPAAAAPAAAPPAAASPAVAAAAEPFKMISIDEVAARISSNDPRTFIFDANTKDTYAKGHVPKAKWVEYDAVPREALPADKDASLVFYCGNEKCMASHKAASQAASYGYPNVYVMSAGIQGWVKSNQPVER